MTLTRLNGEKDVVDTILHEIAHALVGLKAGHGPIWQRKAREIGCNGLRCFGDEVITPKAKYVAECKNGHQFEAHRKPSSRRSCSRCCKTFNPDYILEYKINR